MIIDRFWRALAVAALAGLLGACQTPAPSPAAPPLAKPDRIMLLPQADGSASALIVQSQSGEEVTLSQPDATASVGASRVATSIADCSATSQQSDLDRMGKCPPDKED